MTRTKRYDVTKEDIDKGRPGVCAFCPVAIAIKRETPMEWDVSVGDPDDFISFLLRKGRIEGNEVFFSLIDFPIPESVGAFIDAFDSEESVEPFSFELPDLGGIL